MTFSADFPVLSGIESEAESAHIIGNLTHLHGVNCLAILGGCPVTGVLTNHQQRCGCVNITIVGIPCSSPIQIDTVIGVCYAIRVHVAPRLLIC